MSSSPDSSRGTLRAKSHATASRPSSNIAHGPTTFFLRSERDVERAETRQRGRTVSRGLMITRDDQDSEDSDPTPQQISMSSASFHDGTSFGVQSLEDTIASASDFDAAPLSRTTSLSSDGSPVTAISASLADALPGKRGNPVHPKILATGQRIISADHSHYTSTAASSPSSIRSHAEVPPRLRGLPRDRSTASSSSLGQPLTPLRLSPQRPSSSDAMPASPHSVGSPKSLALSSDEEPEYSETHSQAVGSTSSEEHEDAEDDARSGMPQLVMPSLAMPARRSFTERGRRMGRLKIMVVGPEGVGKTSLIQSICRSCEDIVHVDAVPETGGADDIKETTASTRSYPSWWTDLESRRMLLSRRQSLGDGVLERNLTFIDTPGHPTLSSPSDQGGNAECVRRYFDASLRRVTEFESMSDAEMLPMLSGEGGSHIDVVLLLFDASSHSPENPLAFSDGCQGLVPYLCRWSNVVPVITRADTLDSGSLASRKKEIMASFQLSGAESYTLVPAAFSTDNKLDLPYAISSAVKDDHEELDASVLMSSNYLPPLIPSELDVLIDHLFEPENIARLRHLSAAKLLLWRQQHLAEHIERQLQRQNFTSRFPAPATPDANDADELLDEESKVLVPHASSSYYRSASPASTSSLSGSLPNTNSPALLATTNPSPNPSRIRLAKWALDLQRSLDHERQKYRAWYKTSSATSSPASSPSLSGTAAELSTSHPTDPALSVPDSNNSALILPFSQAQRDNNSSSSALSQAAQKPPIRPRRGHLGGALSVIDPRDPLGLLAFQRQGWFMLKIVGMGAAVFWAVRRFLIVEDWWGFGASERTATGMDGFGGLARREFSLLDAVWRGLSVMGL